MTTRVADTVELQGFQGREVSGGVDAGTRSVMEWALDAALECSPATSLHVLWDGSTLARGGVVGSAKALDAEAPILRKALSPVDKRGGEIHLPDLQILPGKIEFTYLPSNCQAVFIAPVGRTGDGAARGALVFGAAQARTFTPRDLAFLRTIATRVELEVREKMA